MVVTISIRSPGASVPSLSLDAPRIVIGRSRSADVRVPDPSISSRHATIRQRGAEYLLLDEGSTNGTFVGGQRLSPGSPYLLGKHTAVRVGRVWLDISVEQVPPSIEPGKITRDIALGLIAGALEASGNPCAPRLVVRGGPAQGAELALSELRRVYTIGRGDDADLDLHDEEVSTSHVEVTRRGGDVLVRDAGSQNGGNVDGVALVPRKPVLFQVNQRLFVGRSELELVDPLVETLKQLEQEPDEVMAEEEHPAVEAEAAPEKEELSLQPAPMQEQADAVSGAAPKSRSRAGSVRSGWTLTDILVASLSLLVLGASVAGIVWLFAS
jgi:pSer/pThr/pTyr-binding forkhead associated (FHA) protein